MRTLTMYQVGADALTLYASAALADSVGRRWSDRTAPITPVSFAVPPEVFGPGDVIAVELCRGMVEVGDGITAGGRWAEAVGYADLSYVRLDESGAVIEAVGALMELGTDRHIQSMSLIAGRDAFPYRGARLVRARTDTEDGSV